MARHVRFHEHTFPLTTSKQNNSPSPSNTSTCLPPLFPTLPQPSSFLSPFPTSVSPSPPTSPAPAPVLTPIMSACPPLLSPHASLFVDQCPGTGVAPASHPASPKSVALQQPSPVLASPLLHTSSRPGSDLANSPTGLPTVSPPALNLVIDLSHFDLQQVSDSGVSASPPLAAR